MISEPTMLAAIKPLPQWANFLAMVAGIFFAVTVAVLVWFLFFRKKRKRKHRHHHHEKRQSNLTLAQSGGLPPKRDQSQQPLDS